MQSVNFWPQRQRVASAPATCATCFLPLLSTPTTKYSNRSLAVVVVVEIAIGSALKSNWVRGVYAMWKRLAIGEISRKWTRDSSAKHECASGIWQLPRAAQQTGNVTEQRPKKNKWKQKLARANSFPVSTKAGNYLKYCAFCETI